MTFCSPYWYGKSLLKINFNASTSLLQQFHEAFFVFDALLGLAANLFAQIGLQFLDQSDQCALGLFAHLLLQVYHLLDALGLALQPLCDFREILLADYSLLVHLRRDFCDQISYFGPESLLSPFSAFLDLSQVQRQLETLFIKSFQVGT